MKLSLGISPCPNDTYIFDALLHGKIDTEGLEFETILADVETLNTLAMTASLDITKISYGAVHLLLPSYRILDAGGALGKGVGPVFISKQFSSNQQMDHSTVNVALPGLNTTAHLLFSMAYPSIQQKTFVPFHLIEEMVLTGQADAGVIIHENRFTYQQKGLHKISDLGDVWESNTGCPIPLGGILARRDFDPALIKTINRIIRKSLEYANQHSDVLPNFITENAKEMSEDVMRNHIALYVNEYSIALGQEGRAAVMQLIKASFDIHQKSFPENLDFFLNEA